MRTQNFWRRPQAAVAALALAAALGGVGFASAQHLEHVHSLSLKLADANEPPDHAGFAPVVKKVLPAVVNISSSKISKVPTEFQQFPDDPFFRQFFGNGFGQEFDGPGDQGFGPGQGQGQGRNFNRQRQAPERREEGLGSGVIMTPDGYILTNNHVVDGATEVKVVLGDKREFKAKVIGTDPKSDIAVIKIDADNLTPITVGDSSKVQVGDYALAIGDPFGVGKTVTMGIVSATGRSNLGIEAYEDFIQTDAAVNPGNSGGALINDRGELVGINTAIISHGAEGNQGIGFAIPSDMARNVMEQIVEHGHVTRAFMGILPQDLTPDLAKSFGENQSHGALVADVTANSPAQKAGIERGDIIVDVNGKPVADANALRMTISMMQPDSTANIKVLRNGSKKEVAVKLGTMPTEEAANEPEHNSGESSAALSGISVQNLDPETAKEVGVSPETKGVVVTKVDPSSAAAEAGLQRGDVIQEVNRHAVNNTSEFERALSSNKDKPLFLVDRHGTTLYLAA